MSGQAVKAVKENKLCAAYGCNKSKGISLFRFPKDKERFVHYEFSI